MRIFVRNNLKRDVTEKKPGLGGFEIPAGGRLEIFDHTDAHKLPNKETIPFVRNSALEVANSIVTDFGAITTDEGQPALEIEMEDEAEAVISKGSETVH